MTPNSLSNARACAAGGSARRNSNSFFSIDSRLAPSQLTCHLPKVLSASKTAGMKILLLSITAAVLCSGCVAQMVMNSQDRQHYSDYVHSTDELNTDREKSQLAPVHVMTFEEWRGK